MQEPKGSSNLISDEGDLMAGIDNKLDKIITVLERIADQKVQVCRESCSSPIASQPSSRIKSVSNNYMLQVLHYTHNILHTGMSEQMCLYSLKKITDTVSAIKKYCLLCKTMMPRKIIHSGWCVGGSL